MGNGALQGEMRGGAEAREREEAKHDKDQYRQCHAHPAKIIEPLAQAQAEYVEHGNQRQHADGEDEIVDVCVGQMLGARSDKKQAAGGEVEHRGEVRKIAHPIGPRCHKAGKFAVGFAGPDVEAAFLRIAGRKLEYAAGEGKEEPKKGQHPYRDGRLSRGGRGRDPAQAEAADDIEENNIAETELPFQLLCCHGEPREPIPYL